MVLKDDPVLDHGVPPWHMATMMLSDMAVADVCNFGSITSHMLGMQHAKATRRIETCKISSYTLCLPCPSFCCVESLPTCDQPAVCMDAVCRNVSAKEHGVHAVLQEQKYVGDVRWTSLNDTDAGLLQLCVDLEANLCKAQQVSGHNMLV